MRRSGRSREAVVILALVAALWTAFVSVSPLAAYTIYLKDGSAIQSRGKYVLRDDKAYITLPNGTQTFLKATEIDVPRTEQANKVDYGGTSVVLDPGTAPPPGTHPPQQPQRDRLSDLIAKRGTVPRELPGVRRDPPRLPEKAQTNRTKAGFLDFTSMERRPFGQTEVASEMAQFFRGQGIEEVEIHAGSKPDRPLIEVSTNSEGSVFRAIAISANALLHIRDRFPNKVAAFELLLMTPSRERAGQFALTPEMAADLISKKVELAAFYVQNVQF